MFRLLKYCMAVIFFVPCDLFSLFRVQNIPWHNQGEIQKVQQFLIENHGFYDTDMAVCFVPKIKNETAILLICKSVLTKEICGFLFCEMDSKDKAGILSYEVIPEKYGNQKGEIFSALLQEIQKRCKFFHLKQLYCSVHKDKKQFYTKFGFCEHNVIIGAINRLIGLEGSSRIHMQKKL